MRTLKIAALMIILCQMFVSSAYAVPNIPGFIEKSEEHESLTKLLRSQQYQQVKDIVESRLEKSPKTPELLLILAYAEAGLKNWDAALQRMKEVMDNTPQDKQDDFLTDMANIYNLQGNLLKAEQLYKEVLRKKPDDMNVLYNLAFLYQKSGKKTESVSVYSKILQIEPDHRKALNALIEFYTKEKQYDKIISFLNKALEKKPDFAEAYRISAIVSLKQNNIEAAIGYLEKELSLKPSSEAYQLIGRLYLQTGRKEAGMNALNKSLETASLKDSDALAEKGLYDYVQGNFEDSENKLKKAVSESSDKPESHILLIVNLLNQQKYKNAAAEAQNALKKYSEKKEMFLNLLAQAYLGDSKHEEAENTLNKALKIKPDFYLTHINLSALYFQQGKYDKTKEELQQILSRDPKNLQANILLSRTYQATAEYQQAEQTLQKSIEKNPSQPVLRKELILLKIRMKQFEDALKLADKMISLTPESLEGYMLKSRIYTSMGNISEALDVIDIGLEKVGENFAAYAAAAHFSALNGQYARSLNYLERCKAKYGLQRSELKYLYAVNLIETDKIKEAENYIQSEFNADDSKASYLIGISRIKSGDMLKAEEYLEKAVQKDSRFDKAFFDLAKVKLTLKKQSNAKELFKKAIEINPKEAKYYIALATLCQTEGETDSAISLYKQGLSQNPDAVPLLNNIALLYLEKKSGQEAISYANQALKIAPDDPNILDTMGQVYYQLNEFEKAFPYLKKAVEKMPNYNLFHYHLGLCYYKMGSLKEAKKEFDKSLLKNDNVPWASEVRQLIKEIER